VTDPRVRYTTIDALKAAAILTVVYIHGHGQTIAPERPTPAAFLTWWAVPAFLVASGFLHQQDTPIPAARLRAWLRRLLGPYLVATAIALLLRDLGAGFGSPVDGREAAFALLAGSAFNVYYYVPLLCGALIAAVPVARFPRLAVPCLVAFWVTGLLAHAGLDPIPLHFGWFWAFRSPLGWWGYFFAGWVLGRHRDALTPELRHAVGVSAAVLLVAIAGTALACAPLPLTVGGMLLYVTNYCVIAAFLGLAPAGRELPAARFLSDASYPLYLYHIFFTTAVRERSPMLGPWVDSAAVTAGLAGSLLIVLAGRRLLGERSRAVIG
jgi:peptidoglycan/LPS O-acetylase OafA/YrhL